MAISFMCPECGAVFRVPDPMAGWKARCHECEAKFVVPRLLPAELLAHADDAAASADADAAAATADAVASSAASDGDASGAADKAAATARGLNVIGLLGALTLLAAGVLPAVSAADGASFALYEVAGDVEALGLMLASDVDAAPESTWLYGLLLAPLLGLLALGREFMTRRGAPPRNPRFAYLLAAISPFLLGGLIVVVMGQGNLTVDMSQTDSLLFQARAAVADASDTDSPDDAGLVGASRAVAQWGVQHAGPGLWALLAGALFCLIGAALPPRVDDDEDGDADE